jgi:uncharacterized protein involved in tellurium resistance
MCRLSQVIVDWDTLAGLMNISSARRNRIRNNDRYYDDCCRAEEILSIFNNSGEFSREKLACFFQEMSQLHLLQPIITGEWRNI